MGIPQSGDQEGATGLKRLCPGTAEVLPHLDDAAGLHAHVDGITRAGRRIQGART